MNEIYDFMVEKYGYDEPIFTNDLKNELNRNPSAFRQTIKRLSDNGLITKVESGIYFIPNKNSVLKKPMLSVDKIVRKKFLTNQEEIIGYRTGINFANRLGLTTQTASIPTIVTNNTSSNKREVFFYNKKIIVRKPKTKVNSRNYKFLQVLDLLKDFERLSEEPIEEAKDKIIDYLKDVTLSETEYKNYLNSYPVQTRIKFYESGVYNEIARR
ncbi:DUF6088 family protein [Carnobacterium sp. TMP28]|uniref:DUF6088 family protein n=1 Tax=Carnobacterium sp. TMP28 TaxID=3397060 RepID=UPI0039E07808